MPHNFRYFERPHDFSTYNEEASVCDICGEERPGYDGPFYGERDDIERVCEECLATGKLGAMDIETNEGDFAELLVSLAALHPDLNDADRERLAREHEDELSHRTPQIVTWQNFFWPVHCGDYCRYIKEVGKPELLTLAVDGDAPRFVMNHDYRHHIGNIARAHTIWTNIRPDSPRDNTVGYLIAIYLYRCLTCGEPLLIWDVN